MTITEQTLEAIAEQALDTTDWAGLASIVDNSFGGIDFLIAAGHDLDTGQIRQIRLMPIDNDWQAGAHLYTFTRTGVCLGEIRLSLRNPSAATLVQVADALVAETR